VQNLALGAIALVFLIFAVGGAIAFLERRGRRRPLQLALGFGVGLLGAFLVLVSRIDLVPDGPEDGLERLAVVGVTIALVIGTWYRVART
jgi:hypothetical protein